MPTSLLHACRKCGTQTVARMALLPNLEGMVCAECFREVGQGHPLPSSAADGYLLPIRLGCYFPAAGQGRPPRPNWIDDEEEQIQASPTMRPPRPNEMSGDAGCGTGGYVGIPPRPTGSGRPSLAALNIPGIGPCTFGAPSSNPTDPRFGRRGYTASSPIPPNEPVPANAGRRR